MYQGSAPELIGRRVGNYVVERTLAQGGMGSVFVARHPALGREAAVKFLGHDFEAPPELTKRFLDEARITANLRHPNIVDIFDFGELDGRLYYVMELLEGCDLSGLLRRRTRLATDEAIDMLVQIAAGLAAAHAVGVVHRDLKPANVFVLDGEPLRVKLMDFGIAKVLSSAGEHTSYGQIMGTPRYMSPEQALGQADRISPQSDIYSLGVIAYEMLTGSAPFEHESPVMLLIMHVRDRARPLSQVVPDCPAELAMLIDSCLSKAPEERPATAVEIVEQLNSLRRRSGLRNTIVSLDPIAPPSSPPIALVVRPRIGDDDTLRRSFVPNGPDAKRLDDLHSAPNPLPFDAAAALSIAELSCTEGGAADEPLATDQERHSAVVPAPYRKPNLGPVALADKDLPPARSGSSDRNPQRSEPQAVPSAQRLVQVAVPDSPAIAYRDAEAILLSQSIESTDAEPGPEGHTATIQLTESDRNVLSKLLLRMQRKGDFPAFVQNVGEVSKRADFESSFSAQQLGMSILKDYALTAKLLRIVNSAYASRFGGKIYSVQHAIVILGFERVRQLALSISLFKSQGNKDHAERVSESAINSLVSGEISRQLHGEAELDDPEQAVICTMFRNLGRHLVLVYLPELYDQILGLVARDRINMNAASERVLGISMHKLGVGIAERWRLPQRMISAMAVIPERSGRIYREEDRLSALAEFSNQLCEIVASDLDAGARSQALNTLKAKHKHLITFQPNELKELLTTVQQSFEKRYESLLGNATKTSRFSKNVSQLIEEAVLILDGNLGESAEGLAAAPPTPAERATSESEVERSALALEPAASASEPTLMPGAITRTEATSDEKKPGTGSQPEPHVREAKAKKAVARLQLAKTVVENQDASNEPGAPAASVLEATAAKIKRELQQGQATEAQLLALLTAIAGTLKLRRLLLFRANQTHRELQVLCGVGDDVDGLSKELRFSLSSARSASDPFSMAYHVNKAILFEDCFSAKVMSVMPARYYETLAAASLMLLHVPGKPGQSFVLSADLDPPSKLPSNAQILAIAAARDLLGQLASAVARS